MSLRMILRVSYFIPLKEIKMSLKAKDGQIFSIGIIYSDLIRIKD
jgi:hypothetical protein